MNNLKDDERIDDLHRNGYRIIQNPKKFCFGMDAVLLSAFAKAKMSEIVLDIGTGTGVIPILMSAKTNAKKYFAIDIEEEIIDMASRSILLNNLEEKIEILHLDVKKSLDKFKKGSIDVITSNPPYINMGGGLLNDYDKKAIARHEIFCNLDDIIRNTSDLLKPNGRFYMVHRPNRLCDIIITLRKYNLEPKNIRFVQPYIDKSPNIVLIESVKYAKPFLNMMKPLIIYGEDKKYTKEVVDIYYN